MEFNGMKLTRRGIVTIFMFVLSLMGYASFMIVRGVELISVALFLVSGFALIHSILN